MQRYCFLDLETTSLDSDSGDVWEIGVIVREEDDPTSDVEHLWLVQPNLTTANPDSLRICRYYERTPVRDWGIDGGQLYDMAAVWTEDDADEMPSYRKVGQPIQDRPKWSDPRSVADRLARLLDGAIMFGAVPDFDGRFLRRWLRAHGEAFTPHYHLADIEAMAAGYLLGQASGLVEAAGNDYAEPGPSAPLSRAANHRIVAAPNWDTDELYLRVGYTPTREDRHTALGDARSVRDLWDRLNGR